MNEKDKKIWDDVARQADEDRHGGNKSAFSEGLALLLEKWRKRSDRFERDYQFGRDGKDDNTYVHGKCDMIDECIDELVEAMKG